MTNGEVVKSTWVVNGGLKKIDDAQKLGINHINDDS